MTKNAVSKKNGTDGTDGLLAVSNTKKRPSALVHWFLTWNNYDEKSWEYLKQMVPKYCKKWVYQEEIGNQEHTPHIQGSFTFKKRYRSSELAKITKEFGGNGKDIWEPTGSARSLTYCVKQSFEAARIECFPERLELWRSNHPIFDEIENMILNEKPHPRHIYWYWEPKGDVGKSSFTTYMHVKYGVTTIASTKSADIVTVIPEGMKAIIIDFARKACPGTFCPWQAIEQIKNGDVTDGKLKKTARRIIFNRPHVIIFANEPPEDNNMSADKWIVKRIPEVSDPLHKGGALVHLLHPSHFHA